MHRKPAFHKFEEKIRFPAFYTASFLAALHYYLVVYINSSFLKGYVGEGLVGVFYVTGSLISILLFLSISRLLSKLGNYRALIIITAVEAITLLLIALVGLPAVAPLLFIVHIAVAPLIFFSLDIFLEGSLDSSWDYAGQVRGNFLTSLTLAFVLAPLLVGHLVDASGFTVVYVLSAALLIPFISLIALEFRKFIDPKYDVITPKTLLPILKRTWRNADVRNIILAHLVMRLYMAWMAVYLPIYLNDHIGFSWSAIGTLLVIIFLPYFVEFPLGRIADNVLGEKELLIAGFVIMSLATLAIPFVTSTLFFVWAALLFVGRLGNAFVEIMTESYFFKHIHTRDTELLSFFRLLRPASYVLSITIAVAALSVMDLRTTFLILAVIALAGLRFAIPIHDTR